MKQSKIIIIFIITSLSINAQTTIWSENFETGYTDGDVLAQDNNLPIGADWVLSGTGAFRAVSNTSPITGSFSCRTRGGGYTMTSEAIDISSFSNVLISIDLNEVNAGVGDKLETFYNVDGAGPIEFGNENGDGGFNNVTNTASGLSGSSLIITIIGTTNANSDRYKWDNLLVQGTSTLPVELTSFDAYLKNNEIIVNWQTASESNNDFFTIERSKKGIDWEKVVEISSKEGRLSSIRNYSATDKNPYSGLSYYRLKQIDYNGQFSYSDVITVRARQSNSISIYPNPANDLIVITGKEIFREKITILTLLGTDVTRLTKFEEQNTEKVMINVSALNSGLYIVKTKTMALKMYKE